jgi:hypothetical protein
MSFDNAMLKIHKGWEGQEYVIFSLSGRIQAGDAVELRKLVGAQGQRVVLDLKEVKLVDRTAVRFLALSEAEGIELRNPSPYIREWITREWAGTSGTDFPQESD